MTPENKLILLSAIGCLITPSIILGHWIILTIKDHKLDKKIQLTNKDFNITMRR